MSIRHASQETTAFGRMHQWLLASDPGLTRLRMGSRVLLSVVLVAAVLASLHPWLVLPPAAYGLAMVTAIQGAIAIKDATPAARAVTRVYAAISGFIVIAIIVLCGAIPYFIHILFLTVIFIAVYARKFGTRSQGVGMFTFMCFVIAAYLRPTAADLPGIALTLVLSAVVAHLTRNFLLPDRPADDFRRCLSAVEGETTRLTAQIRRAMRFGWTRASRNDALKTERRAKDAILLCEGFLPIELSTDEQTSSPAAKLAGVLFDLHLALESALRVALSIPGSVGQKLPPPVAGRLDVLAKVRRAVRNAVRETPTAAFTRSVAPARPSGAASGGRKWLDDPALRQAFQVTIASAIAMTGGFFLSPDRWFWAVLTAFLIFTNTQSRGEATIRGLERAAGTALGIAAGIGMATLLHGSVVPTLLLIAISVFLAFYLLTVSYSGMSFFITIAISLVYGLTGNFSPNVLILRLEETAIGAAAGIFVSFFVLTQSTHSQTRRAIDRLMLALDQLLEEAQASDGPSHAARLLVRTRQLDSAHAGIQAASGPLSSVWTFGTGQANLRRGLMRVNALVHAAHVLARHFGAFAPQDSERKRLQGIRDQIAELNAHGRNFSERSTLASAPEASDDETSDGGANDSSTESVEYALRAMLHILQQIDPKNQAPLQG